MHVGLYVGLYSTAQCAEATNGHQIPKTWSESQTWFRGTLQEQQVLLITEHLFIPNQNNPERSISIHMCARRAQYSN